MEHNLVENWLRVDPRRWMAGVVAGLVAAGVMTTVGAIFCKIAGYEPLMALKVWAVPAMGNAATDYAASSALIVGALTLGGLAAVLGLTFAHFAYTNALAPLLGLGFTWGVFGWIFMNNLMFQSWRSVFALDLSRGATFAVWIAFGLSLASVSVVDRLVRK